MPNQCVRCGHALSDGVKFCPECGVKQEGTTLVSRIDIAPLALELPECKIEVTGIQAEGPNDDGDYSITVKYTVTNDTSEDWEYLETRTQILSATGQIMEETRDTQEQSISAGESAEFESCLWRVKARVLGANPEQAHAVVSVIACGLTQEKLGQVAIPDTPFDAAPLKPVKLGSLLQLVSGSLWKTEPDSDKDCQVEIKALVQNLTRQHLPQVKLIAEVTDKQGRNLTDATGYDEVRTGNIAVICGSCSAKERKLVGATLDMSLAVYWPVAAGVIQGSGLIINESETSNVNEDSDDEETGDSPEQGNDSGGAGIAKRFYANMKWFEVAEQPGSFDNLPPEFRQAKKLWDQDAEGNIERIIEILSPYVGARYIPSNSNSWEELFSYSEEYAPIELDAAEVRVVGIDFSESPIPMCKAEAEFDIQVTEGFDSTDLESWQEQNGPLTDGVSFYWNIPRDNDTEDLDFTYGNNQGVEFLPLGGDSGDGDEEIGDEGDRASFSDLSQSHTPRDAGNTEGVLSSFLDEIKERVRDKKVFCHPNIPEKKLNNAIRSFAHDIDKSEVLILIDSTVFGSASEGMIVTADSVHAKNLGTSPLAYKMEEIKEVAFKQSMLNPGITINGNDFFQSAGIDKDAMTVIAENLNVFCNVTNILNAAKVILLREGVSISTLVRNMGLGYSDAAQVLEQLEAEGFVSPMNPDGTRVLINRG